MDYKDIDEIKERLNDDDVSLYMLHELRTFLDKKIESWGKESGKQYRIM